ncbi:MAG: GTPase Era [Bacteroidota bacterium]|jgi:GTP-binding protein Era
MFKAGFVNIVGMPNAGKSTLVNALTGQRVSITHARAQTTRHRIMGILNGEDFQIVFSDTPGYTKPAYRLHEQMNLKVEEAIKDADILIWVVDAYDAREINPHLLKRISLFHGNLFLVLNKIDLVGQEGSIEKITEYKNSFPKAHIFPVSAANRFGLEALKETIIQHLPEHPRYFEGDDYTDRSMRFYVSEIIRRNILSYYAKEIPYAVEVVVKEYQEEPEIDKIHCDIVVSRDSQKGIILGEAGKAIKKLGIHARREIEQMTGKKVFLKLFVRVDKNWRDNSDAMKTYGYE